MHARAARAFTLSDLTAALASTAVLFALILAGFAESRRGSQLDESLANLKRFASIGASYAADHDDAIPRFTWKSGETYLMRQPDGTYDEITFPPGSDVKTAAYQAVHIMRENGDRVDADAMPTIDSWIPHASMNHLVLQAYEGTALLDRWVVSPADRVRVNWQDNPTEKFDLGFWLPLQPDPFDIANRRWPYSSSYNLVPATWDYYQSEPGPEFNSMRFYQGLNHWSWNAPNFHPFEMKGRTMSDVLYPSGKVFVHDTHQRHFGDREPYFGLDEARVALAGFDASADVRHTDDSNPGWRANQPTFNCQMFWYQPREWEPATTNGKNKEIVKGVYRWTRAGLKGLDFGGVPVNTGQKTPGECDL